MSVVASGFSEHPGDPLMHVDPKMGLQLLATSLMITQESSVFVKIINESN